MMRAFSYSEYGKMVRCDVFLSTHGRETNDFPHLAYDARILILRIWQNGEMRRFSFNSRQRNEQIAVLPYDARMLILRIWLNGEMRRFSFNSRQRNEQIAVLPYDARMLILRIWLNGEMRRLSAVRVYSSGRTSVTYPCPEKCLVIMLSCFPTATFASLSIRMVT